MGFTERYAPVGNIGEFAFRIARDLAATITRGRRFWLHMRLTSS
jgi:hypothetical protein